MNISTSKAKFNRRSLLTAAATLPLATMATAKPTDPHMQWLKEWKSVDKHWMQCVDGTPEDAAASAEHHRLAMLICNTQATTIDGLAAQYEWFQLDLGYIYEDMVGEAYANAMNNIGAGVRAVQMTA